MRASVIVCLFVIALVGLGLRSRSEASRHAATRVHAQERQESKGPKKPPKNPPAPPEAEPPKPPIEAEEAQPPKQTEPLIHREPKVKPVEPPKVLWNREITGEARTTNTAAHQSALEAAALAFGEYLKERFPGFRWSPTAEFLNDMVVE